MLSKELRRFGGGDCRLPMEVMKRFCLPMPDDVLEQLIADHGAKEGFQERYENLDLHAPGWRLATLPAAEVLAAAMFPEFDIPEMLAKQTRAVSGRGWADIGLCPEEARSWQGRSAWLRPPVYLRGEVMRSDRPIYLVAGHGRFGALKGPVECGSLPADSPHQFWIGEPAPRSDEGPWRASL